MNIWSVLNHNSYASKKNYSCEAELSHTHICLKWIIFTHMHINTHTHAHTKTKKLSWNFITEIRTVFLHKDQHDNSSPLGSYSSSTNWYIFKCSHVMECYLCKSRNTAATIVKWKVYWYISQSTLNGKYILFNKFVNQQKLLWKKNHILVIKT